LDFIGDMDVSDEMTIEKNGRRRHTSLTPNKLSPRQEKEEDCEISLVYSFAFDPFM
jgi:hypothetical protein